MEWRPSSDATVAIFAGSSRGGLKCVSGLCREFPAFEGAKLLVSYRY